MWPAISHVVHHIELNGLTDSKISVRGTVARAENVSLQRDIMLELI